MPDLRGKVAVVTGASRGVGKGIALGLCEVGATVYVTGRTRDETPDRPGTVARTAQEAAELGGECIAIQCDHRDDTQVEAVFRQVEAQQGRLDILVNNVWAGYENMIEDGEYTWEMPFWKQPLWRWDAMFDAGVRAHYVASRFAAPLMVEQRSGLIVTISFWAAQKYMGNAVYSMSKAADDRMAAAMAHDLREHNVASVSLYPGLVRTEAIMRVAEYFDMSNSESPQFVGRAVAALAGDPAVMEKTGQVLVSAAIADEYGFVDVDGKQVQPATLDTA